MPKSFVRSCLAAPISSFFEPSSSFNGELSSLLSDGNRGRLRRLEGTLTVSCCIIDSASLGIDPHKRTFTFTCVCVAQLVRTEAVMIQYF